MKANGAAEGQQTDNNVRLNDVWVSKARGLALGIRQVPASTVLGIAKGFFDLVHHLRRRVTRKLAVFLRLTPRNSEIRHTIEFVSPKKVLHLKTTISLYFSILHFPAFHEPVSCAVSEEKRRLDTPSVWLLGP